MLVMVTRSMRKRRRRRRWEMQEIAGEIHRNGSSQEWSPIQQFLLGNKNLETLHLSYRSSSGRYREAMGRQHESRKQPNPPLLAQRFPSSPPYGASQSWRNAKKLMDRYRIIMERIQGNYSPSKTRRVVYYPAIWRAGDAEPGWIVTVTDNAFCSREMVNRRNRRTERPSKIKQ